MILAGGLGTRLRPLTFLLPKPMVPVMNRPLLEHTLTLLKKHHVDEIVFLLFYLPELIRSHFGDGSRFGVKIDYLVAREDFGTAGALKQAAHFIDEPVFLLSGDAITDIDLIRLREFHAARRALATIALSSVPNPSPFGVAMTDKQNRITRFVEKPAWSEIFSDTVSMGIYVLQPEILDFIPANQAVYFAKDIFPDLLHQNRALYGFVDACYWKDIGDLRAYQQVHWDILSGAVELDIAAGTAQRQGGTVFLGKNCKIHDQARLHHVVIGDNCAIGRHSSLAHTVLWNNVTIGQDCEVVDSVIACDSVVEDGTTIEQDVFVG
ncbi:MAG: sugar phosphate nucleotidyltransferase [bacterium]